MRILNEVISVGSILSAIIVVIVVLDVSMWKIDAAKDYEETKEESIIGVSELLEFSNDQFTSKSRRRSIIRTGVNLLPIMIGKVRREREIGINGVEDITKGRKGRRKKKNDQRVGNRGGGENRKRERMTERYTDVKNDRKKGEPLTRLHASWKPQRRRRIRIRPYKEAGVNRKRPSRRESHHERRNMEKEYLVRNRTLELLEDKKMTDVIVSNRSSLIYPVNNIGDLFLDKKIITPEKIGQILSDGSRRAPDFRITDLLIPKTQFADEKKSIKISAGIEADDFDPRIIKPIGKSASNYTESVNDPPLFLEKFKSIAMNVSMMNKSVRNFEGDHSDEETTDFDETSYRYDYENVFENPSVSPWVNPPRSKEPFISAREEDHEYFLDTAILSSVYMPIDDQNAVQESLAILLSRLFQTLRNMTDEENRELLQDLDFDNSVHDDLCQKWLDAEDKLEEAFLGPLVLPACPCHYPSSIFYNDKIWDELQERHFRWRDVSGESERLDVYKPGATYCIRSLLAQGGGSAAAQHCCYDLKRRLLTRGSGAGTPNYVSPEVSSLLHERIDILPWRLCKGDFSRFNEVRPPNNDNHCRENPKEDEYQRQIDTTRHY